MVSIDATYTGDLHCTATHDPSGIQLTTDAPEDNHGRGASFSPTDLVATGLGTCVVTILGIQAEKHGLDLDGTEVHIEKEMASDPRRIDTIRVAVTMPAALDERTRKRLEQAARHCPVHHSLHPEVDVPITFHWPERTDASA